MLYYRFLFFLGCTSRPSTKYFLPHRTLYQFLCPIAQQAGQAAVLGRLSLSIIVCVSGCPPPRGSKGGHTRLREKGSGEPIRTKGQSQTLWYSTLQRIPQLQAPCCRVKIPLFSFQLILAPVVHWLALVLRLLCPALYFFIMERRARKES